MKVISSVDDLDFHQTGERVEATETRVVVLGRVRVELDLSEQHAKELDELLRPYLEAGQRTTATTPAPSRTGTRDYSYNRAMRAWADAQNPPIRYRSDKGGKPAYSVHLRRAFADHLAQEAARQS